MSTLNYIRENNLISLLAGHFRRSPLQMNKLHESDAELIRISGSNSVLAVTTDNIVEEIESGLYKDPYVIGWMTVMVNVSDISAVGALPLGLLLNESLIPSMDRKYLAELQRGIDEACTAAGICVLGGDTNFSSKFQIGACALGIINDGKIISRIGGEPGDFVYSTGLLGGGNAFALSCFLLNNGDSKFPFKPAPRLKEGSLIRRYASCCMDTSDGLIATLDQLMRLNNYGITIEKGCGDFMDPNANQLCENAGFPEWLLLAGIHGEFELVFTIPGGTAKSFLSEAETINWKPLLIGEITEPNELKININNKLYVIDSGKIRNMFDESGGKIKKYVSRLMEMHQELVSNKKKVKP